MKKKPALPTVYARREPTTDSATHDMFRAAGTPNKTLKYFDVQIYKDRKRKEKFGRFNWHSPSCPTRRNKYVTLNCYRWRLVWL